VRDLIFQRRWPTMASTMLPSFQSLTLLRYADDIICHCKSADEARALWSALADRLATCKLVLHPEKTKIVYCKDANRRGLAIPQERRGARKILTVR
jgi:hypothetical protein